MTQNKYDILAPDGVVKLYSGVLDANCVRKFSLMSEDSITLSFFLRDAVSFPVGSSVGDFFITKEQVGTWNASTGIWDYQLKLDAYYWLWANKILRYIIPGVDSAKETSFSLTATIDVHAAVIKNCLDFLGLKFGDSPFRFDTTDTSLSLTAKLVKYENLSILGGIQAIAETFECEWWVDGNAVYFGRCENKNSDFTFEAGVNVSSISFSQSKEESPNRLYVFGSDRNLPANYRETSGNDTIGGVVNKRLMLPEGTPYLQTTPNLPESQIVEAVAVLESVYPKTDLTITEEPEVYVSESKQENGDTISQTFYRIKYGTGFPFLSSYVLPNEELHVIFQSGLLNGMEFGVRFNPKGLNEKKQDGTINPEAQMFEIIANGDYGRQLPDDILRPYKDDKFILTGWDSTKMAALGLIANAEAELLEEGQKALVEYAKDTSTCTCPMAWDYMKPLIEQNRQPKVGDAVTIIDTAHFGKGGRKSRIIGYEYKLDKPYAECTYTCGENVSVSRLKSIENKIEGLTKSGTKVQMQNSLDFLSKRYADRTPYLLSSDTGFEIGRFLAGVSGGQFAIDKETGHSYAELDKLYVRVRAYFESLTVIERESLAGEQQITPGGGVVCTSVEEVKDADDNLIGWRCYFLSEQDGEKRETKIIAGDQAIAQIFNATTGTTNKVSNKRWWRLVTDVSNDAKTDDSGNHYGYIEVSKGDCETGSDIPKAGDEIVQFGSREDATRQAAIIISTVSADAPSMKLFTGIGGGTTNEEHYSLVDRDIISYGYDHALGRAYMRCYGDLWLGDKGGTSYVKYDSGAKKWLFHNVSISATSTIGDKTIDQYIKDVVPPVTQEDIEGYVNAIVDPKIDGIQNQIDGVIETHFFNGVPTLANYPASEWGTEELKIQHLGDLYYDNDTGTAYRFSQKADKTYYWNVITDDAITKALAAAQKAQDTADSKRRTFTGQPVPPYEVGDIWVNATYGTQYNNDILRCVTAKAKGGTFSISDWTLASKYTDDTLAQATQKEIADYKYLKEALRGASVTQGGLFLSSYIKLGEWNLSDPENPVMSKVWAGHNGIYGNSKTIASFWGGDMVDRFYDENGNLRDNPLISGYAAALVRMDGGAYFGGGKHAFNPDGSGWLGDKDTGIKFDGLGGMTFGSGIKININEGETGLKETLESILNFQAAVGNLLKPCDANNEEIRWVDATLSDGAGGIRAKSLKTIVNFFSEKSVSAKGPANGGSSGRSTLEELNDVRLSNPTSGQTLVYNGTYWVNQLIKTGLDESALAAYLTDNSYAKKSDIPSLTGYATQDWVTNNGYITSAALAGYATESWVTDKGYLTETKAMGIYQPKGSYLTNHQPIYALTIQKNGSTVGTYTPNSKAATINLSDVASASALSSHIADTTSHITAVERTKWNKVAADFAAITGADSDNIINKWEEVVDFLDTYTEADTLATLLSNKVDKTTSIGAGVGLTGGGTLAANRTLSLATSGVTAGTYFKTTVDVYGRVTSGSNPTTLSGFGITDVYTKSEVNAKDYLTVIDAHKNNGDGWQETRCDMKVRFYDVYENGGPTTYGNVMEIAGRWNHWQPQLWFDSGTSGSIRHRNKGYNYNIWGDWATLLDSRNYSSILDSRYYTKSEADSRFVNVSGDTMTGALTVNAAITAQSVKIGGATISWDSANGALKVDTGLYFTSFIASKGTGSGGSSGSGAAYNRLDNWGDYTTDKASWVLSAKLGYDLKTRIDNLPTTSVNPYALTIQRNGATLGVYDGSAAKTINISDVASAASLSSLTSRVGTLEGSYVTLGTAQKITGVKTFRNGTWVLEAYESNEIKDVAYHTSTIGQGSSASLSAITRGIDFRWYETHWVIGNIRGDSSDTQGFGIGLLNNDGKLDLGLRVTKDKTYAAGYATFGGTSSQILMADGSVKSVNDVVSITTTGSGNAVTSISKSGTVITANKGATYLTSHQTLDHIGYVDRRDNDLAPYAGGQYKGVEIQLKTNSTDGLSDGGYFHGILNLHQWNNKSGGAAHQLAFTDNGYLWMRYGFDSWSAWHRFAYIDDLANYYTKSETDSGFVKIQGIRSDLDSIYALRFSVGVYDKGDYLGEYAGEYPTNYGTYLSLAYNNRNSAALMFFDASIQDALGRVYVRTRTAGDSHTTYSDWGALAYTSDIPTKLSQLTNDSGYATQSWVNGNFAKLASPNNLVHSGNEITMVPSGYSGALWFNNRTCGGYNGAISKYNFGNGNAGFASLVASSFIREDGHSYQFLKADGSVDGTRYVNASGDTMSGASENLLSLDSTGSNCWIYFKLNGVNKASVGYYSGMAFIANETANYAKIGVNDTGIPQYWPNHLGTNKYTLWHAGNDGSGSRLDADLLDGYHGSRYMQCQGGYNYITINVGGDANTYYPVVIRPQAAHYPAMLLNITRAYNETAPDTWNTSTHKGGLTLCILWNASRYWDGNGAGAPGHQQILMLGETYSTMFAGMSSATTGMVVWLRGGGAVYHIYSAKGTSLSATVYTSNYTDSASQVFAPTTSVKNYSVYRSFDIDVASATKLQATRTLWGQNFDGTGNVSGNMTGVGTIRLQGTADSYREGIRIKPYNNWSTIVLGGNDLTADSGISANSWSLMNNNGYFYINKNASSDLQKARLWGHSNGWTVGDCSTTSYALNTASFICDSWVRTKNRTGWYNETYQGGWYMTDSIWIRGYNGKSLYMGNGEIQTLNNFNRRGAYNYSWNNGMGAYNVALPNNLSQTPLLLAYNQAVDVGSATGANRFFAMEVLNDGSLLHFCFLGNYKYSMTSGGVFHAIGGVTTDGYMTAKLSSSSSDIRLKNVIGDTALSLRDIANAPSKYFTWEGDNHRNVGTIAQYWLNVLPEVVLTDDKGLYSVAYGNLGVAIGISNSRELLKHEDEIDRLKRRVDELEKKNRELELRLQTN